ncbi:hypothetical protein [Actinoplanes sp. N902-109]|uniref:PKD domain-containing protein n=1 Tax=Actinoplanes sp. (strain N902-109) TaxID=649831 RepID=UPI0003A7CC35|nr:hypothetical protein [Actinoplanes sp. N902-109]
MFTVHTVGTNPPPSPTTSFAMWPDGHPDQRTVIGSSIGANPRLQVDLRGYADGTVLAWTAQASDVSGPGPDGAVCYLTVDNTAPPTPLVSSKKYATANYPGTGGAGVPGNFIFDTGGSRDVTSFEYSVNRMPVAAGNPVAAPNHPGGRAKVSVAPSSSGSEYVEVRSLDAAGNASDWTKYTFYVRDSAPFATIDNAGIGLTSHIRLQAISTDVTSFGYTVDGGPETRVPAIGQKATGSLVFTSAGTKTIVEHSYAGKKLAGAHTDRIVVTDAPGVSAAADPISGRPETFTLTARSVGVVAFKYDFGGDQQRITADADGSAKLSWTPPAGGTYTITVTSVDGAGHESTPAVQTFYVIDAHPNVGINDTPVLGQPIEVFLWTDVPGVTGFVYTFDGGTQQSVHGPNAAVDVVPRHAGDSPFTAQGVLADGTLTPPTTIQLSVPDAPGVTLTGPYGNSAVAGRPATFTLVPPTQDVVGYQYTLADGTSGTVDEATITYTPADPGYGSLTVRGVHRDGSLSADTRVDYIVLDPQIDTWGIYENGWFAFSGDLMDVTVTYLWHVNDGPVQETPADPDGYGTFVQYAAQDGENHLYIQRVFTDGAVSPLQDVSF